MGRTLFTCKKCMWYIFIFLTVFENVNVHGHGRLVYPPGRSTMWRYGFNTPINYNDHELFCGGFPIQWWVNGGKCGSCGDPYNSAVRENEPPNGKYAKGIITATYRRGETITIKVEITASHKGYFEFRLCPNNNVKFPAIQDCLDRHLLREVHGKGTKVYVDDKSNRRYDIDMKWPDDVICNQCVLQWRYRTGNRWGCYNGDSTKGPCGMGYGPQEEFYACSDITIQPNNVVSRKPTMGPTTIISRTSTQLTSSSKPQITATTQQTTVTNEKTTASPMGPNIKIVCASAGAWKGSLPMDNWCVINCKRNYCPATHCECRPEGQLVDDVNGLLGTGRDCFSTSRSRDLDVWCRHNCPIGFCDANVCHCAEIRRHDG